MKQKNSGFTLIELVIVIVVLGILSASAIPKFLDLSSDAHSATVDALAGGIKSGANIIYAKANVDNVADERLYEYDIDGDGSTDVWTHSGYPGVMNNASRFISGLPSWIDIDISTDEGTDTQWFGILDWNTFYFMPSEFDSEDDNCYVSYQEATDADGSALDYITVSVETDGC